MDADLTFSCPRCASQVMERFYGPCMVCRGQLSAAQQGAARHVDTERFEPKLHVVPNHVATKE